MSELDLAGMLPELERIAREAGRIAMGGYRRGAAVRKKGSIDLVTEYDEASEAHIAKELARVFPDIGVIGEESQGKRKVEGAADDAWRFFVDPIDGTTNFAHGHPFFCVSLGLCRGSAPLAGVIYAPALDLCWRGAVGHGAFRNGEPCSVSQCEAMSEALCATGFGYEVAGKQDDNVPEFGAVQARARGVRRCGAAALDLALVADGTYDAYWEYMLQPWDMAAGAALVMAAGGLATGFRGEPLDVLQGAVVASSCASLHEELRATVHAARGGRPVPTR